MLRRGGVFRLHDKQDRWVEAHLARAAPRLGSTDVRSSRLLLLTSQNDTGLLSLASDDPSGRPHDQLPHNRRGRHQCLLP
jgi:hypothetical protein